MSSKRPPKPVRTHHLLALLLLAGFVAQCCWFIYSVPISQMEANQVLRGVALLQHHAGTPSPEEVSSPLVPLLSVAGLFVPLRHDARPLDQFWLDQHRWFIRMPFLFAGFCLALSLWYVARRLYGNAGGYVALALFAFSPGMVASSSLAGPQVFAAWGAFGLIFTALATAHTLYAPRDAILWNWRRIALLGVSITFAAGAQWPLLWLLLPAAALMLWAVPHRRGAALLILVAAAAISLVLLDLVYLANLGSLARGLSYAGLPLWALRSLSPGMLARPLASFFFEASPATLAASACAIVAWCVSRRSRFFGNTAPLIVFALLVAMAVLFAQTGTRAILFAALPFLILFAAGVFADLVEGRLQAPAHVVIFAFIAAQAAYSIVSLMRMYSRPLSS